ncbi:MAG: beta-N-acetylhexosaminidase [Clostridia bacterium]|nr:beta-N-acetylhexosaminidase [Clostridia bacterium]
MNSICLMGLEPSLLSPTIELCKDIGIELCENGLKVKVSKGKNLSIKKNSQEITMTYQKKNEWFRALTLLSQFLEDEEEICEAGKYDLLCYMADNSRNAVFNIPSAKKMIRYLASMGYNSMMLYTEDTYEIPGYKYFGYMRGRFSADELRELDDYADSFGIELIPCIQTLAHLEKALRWPDFAGYTDTDRILMVGDERTYKFVRAALEQCKRCFRSRQINIGMDEAHMIARGNYLKKNGYRNQSDVMLEHLNRVVEICRELEMHPMIWSDMFFRMAYGTYYIKEGMLPQDVVDKVPEGLELIYFDYHSRDRERFGHMLDCHNQFNNPICFAGGAWKWGGFAAHNAFSLQSTKMQLSLCEERGINRVIVTGWGDNGGEASQFSVLPSMLYFAERCYKNDSEITDAWMNLRAETCFHASFDTLMAFDLPDSLPEASVDAVEKPRSPAKCLLYNDPFERLMDHHMNRNNVTREYAERAQKLMHLAGDPHFGYAFETLGYLCRALSLKAEMGWRLYENYRDGNRDELKKIAGSEIPELIETLKAFLECFRLQWYRENKTFGFTVQEIRIGGLITRMESVKLRVEWYLSGKLDRIEELECESLPYKPDKEGEYLEHRIWERVAFVTVE